VFVVYIVESSKSFAEAIFDLPPVVQRLGFVVQHVHDLCDTQRHKEMALDDECQVFAVVNYRLTEQLLAVDMRFSLNLPWRISVFTENGATKIGVLSPLILLNQLSANPMLDRVAREIEEKLIQIVDEAR
jgi:uncharacterized protein (DUF302 family)